MQKQREEKIYVEVGPNLRAVLEAMISKIFTANSSPSYYQIAFGPICHLISQLINKEEKNENKGIS